VSSKRRARGSSSRPRILILTRLLGSLALSAVLALVGLFLWAVVARPARIRAGWVVFEAGPDSNRILRDLYHEQLIDSPLLMQTYLRLLVPWGELRPGPHLLEYGLTAREIMQRLSADPARPIEKITIVEGWNRWDIAARLEQSGIVAESAFLKAASDPELLETLDVGGDSAEGLLFPATYPFHLDSSPEDVVRKLVLQARKRIQLARAKLGAASDSNANSDSISLSEHDLVTLASVVEKETGVAEERPRIAQVFLNRLAHPEGETMGRLQSDPTAGYGCRLAPERASSCAHFDSKITPALLADPENAYNTYRHPGLPPGPIGNPGSAAIEAVLAPAGGDELYFVADGQGGHRFSRSYDEHRRAVDALRLRRRPK
jgi:UPF0755 protein